MPDPSSLADNHTRLNLALLCFALLGIVLAASVAFATAGGAIFIAAAVASGGMALVAAWLLVLARRHLRAMEWQMRSERQYREIFEGAVGGIFRSTPEGRLIAANPAMARIFGFASTAEMIAKRTDLARQGYARPEMRDVFKRRIEANGNVTGFEYEVFRADGTLFWVSETARVIRDSTGRIVCYEGLLEDIEARKRSEEELRQADRRSIEAYERLLDRLALLAQALATAPRLEDVFRALLEFVVVSAPCNGMFVSLYDAARQERRCVYAWSEGREEDVAMLPPLPMTESPHSRAVRTGQIVITDDFQPAVANMPGVNLGGDVDPREPQSSIVVPMAVMGRVLGAMEIQSVDRAAYNPDHVTALRMAAALAGIAAENVRFLEDERGLRLKAEDSVAKLRDSEAFLEIVGYAAHVGGWRVDLPQQRVVLSAEVCRIFEMPAVPSASLERALAFYTPECRDRVRLEFEACVHERRPLDARFQMQTAKGRRVWVRLLGHPVVDGEGRVLRMQGALQDITAQVLAEQGRDSLEGQLRESQKMEAIGLLAGGIAHDFNNILGAILGNVDLARMEVDGRPGALESLDEIGKAGRRGRDLVGQILSFSRKQPVARRPVCLRAIIEESASLLRATLPARTRIEVEMGERVPLILADVTQVGQVLLNLATNASDAMGGAPGTIRIGVEGFDLPASGPRPPGLEPGRYARISVADDGQGMDAKTLGRIFEPFFTTKAVGEGTGLGLAVVRGIMGNHGGGIVVDSAPGKGTRFELYFPEARGVGVVAPPVEAAAVPRKGNGEHVLYLDDDEAQVFLVKRMLERRGYRVSGFLSQHEALDALRSDPGQFSLFVTDYNMPGMSGLDVARAARDIRPGLPVAVATGYVTDQLREQASDAGVRDVIFKPNVVKEFIDVVQRLVAPS
jgi:PAS domain S-box-containing protein